VDAFLPDIPMMEELLLKLPTSACITMWDVTPTADRRLVNFTGGILSGEITRLSISTNLSFKSNVANQTSV
jgi:hypothetical protein